MDYVHERPVLKTLLMVVMTVFLGTAVVKYDCHLTCYSKPLDVLAQLSVTGGSKKNLLHLSITIKWSNWRRTSTYVEAGNR
jgi:hypothetical protein